MRGPRPPGPGLEPPLGFRRNIAIPFGAEKLESFGYPMAKFFFEDMVTRFDKIHERDRHTDGQTDRHTDIE